MIRVHETGLRRGGGHSEQTESSGCGPLPAYGGLSEDRLRRGGAPIHCFIGKPSELKTVHDPGGHWLPGSWRLSEKPGGFFRQKVAVCCAHNLCAIGAQIPHLQPEKYFLSRTCRERK